MQQHSISRTTHLRFLSLALSCCSLETDILWYVTLHPICFYILWIFINVHQNPFDAVTTNCRVEDYCPLLTSSLRSHRQRHYNRTFLPFYATCLIPLNHMVNAVSTYMICHDMFVFFCCSCLWTWTYISVAYEYLYNWVKRDKCKYNVVKSSVVKFQKEK